MEVLDYVTVENVMPKEFCNNIIHKIQERRERNVVVGRKNIVIRHERRRRGV